MPSWRFCGSCELIEDGVCSKGHWPHGVPHMGYYNRKESIVLTNWSGGKYLPWWEEVILRPSDCEEE